MKKEKSKSKQQSKTSSKKEVDPIKSKKSKTSVKKGKDFEREIANLIGHIFPDAARNLEYQAFKAAEGVDLVGTDIFKIQAKNRQGYASVSTIYEVKQLQDGDIPVLITKGNRLPPMAVLPFKDFIYMLEVMYGLEPIRSSKKLELVQEKKLRLIEAIEREVPSIEQMSLSDLI